jgi:hypothetical protein
MGVNRTSVKDFVLAIGDRNPSKTQAGGKGRVVLDAIRLYPSRCVPTEAKPAGDFNDDCTVDWTDLRTFATAWLAVGQWIQPKDPGKATGHWKLDGDAVESLSRAEGTVAGVVAIQGIEDLAMKFSTDADYIDLGPKAGEIVSTLESFTMSIWANPDMIGGAWQRLFDLGNSDEDYVFVSLSRGAPLGTGPRYGIRVAGGTEQAADSTLTLTGGEWNHVAATLDGSARTSTLYVNGQVGARNTNVTFIPRDLGVTLTNYLGKSHYTVDAVYRGLLDDFRLFNRALSEGEILSLAKAAATYRFEGQTGRADLNADGIVDGTDLAMLANSWKTWQEWP